MHVTIPHYPLTPVGYNDENYWIFSQSLIYANVYNLYPKHRMRIYSETRRRTKLLKIVSKGVKYGNLFWILGKEWLTYQCLSSEFDDTLTILWARNKNWKRKTNKHWLNLKNSTETDDNYFNQMGFQFVRWDNLSVVTIFKKRFLQPINSACA